MDTNINGKMTIASGHILFHEGDVAVISGTVRVKVQADQNKPPAVNIQWEGGTAVISVNGLSATNFEQVGIGSGTYNGQPYSSLVRATRVAKLPERAVYAVDFNFFLT